MRRFVFTLLTVPVLLEKLSQESAVTYRLLDMDQQPRLTGTPQDGNQLELFFPVSGKVLKTYKVVLKSALPPILQLHQFTVTAGVSQNITLDFFCRETHRFVW